jgi:hypothetical protein
VGEELAVAFVMLVAKARGNQNLERLVEKFLARVAEKLFRLRVHEDDLAARIHDDHRIGRSLDQIAERPLHMWLIISRAAGLM